MNHFDVPAARGIAAHSVIAVGRLHQVERVGDDFVVAEVWTTAKNHALSVEPLSAKRKVPPVFPPIEAAP